jgi:hypothetical protein
MEFDVNGKETEGVEAQLLHGPQVGVHHGAEGHFAPCSDHREQIPEAGFLR